MVMCKPGLRNILEIIGNQYFFKKYLVTIDIVAMVCWFHELIYFHSLS